MEEDGGKMVVLIDVLYSRYLGMVVEIRGYAPTKIETFF